MFDLEKIIGLSDQHLTKNIFSLKKGKMAKKTKKYQLAYRSIIKSRLNNLKTVVKIDEQKTAKLKHNIFVLLKKQSKIFN